MCHLQLSIRDLAASRVHYAPRSPATDAAVHPTVVGVLVADRHHELCRLHAAWCRPLDTREHDSRRAASTALA
eukprot:CAMPEP_0115867160 /NCGR_PEP_ID=MMETSP0287-20121206/20623_1 /TAXON_ID=412157 /ORGANISM="Chrysochromulina rotalis, Strain UIO044" /LENGTH=72 /DNA_ID=CAMNT_0003321753 /DNA_START=216 /DNA_END=430 /DNA_ORIENTATION=-